MKHGVTTGRKQSARGSLPLFDRLSLRIGLLFRGTLVLLPLPIIRPEWFTIGVDTLTSAIVIARTPEITLIAHLKGRYENTVLVRNVRPKPIEALKTMAEVYVGFGNLKSLTRIKQLCGPNEKSP